MKLVKESISFKRGDNSYKKLSIGEFRPIQIGDRFKVTKDLVWNSTKDDWVEFEPSRSFEPNSNYFLNINDILILFDIRDEIYNTPHLYDLTKFQAIKFSHRIYTIDKDNMEKFLVRI